MKKIKTLIAALAVIALAGCQATELPADSPLLKPTSKPESSSSEKPESSAAPPVELTAAEKLLREMTLEEKVGQLFVVRVDALRHELSDEIINGGYGDSMALSDEMRIMMSDYHVGGLVLFANNISEPKQLKKFTADLIISENIPPFIAVDEEGGSVARIGNNSAFYVERFPAMSEIGASEDEEEAYHVGEVISEYLLEYGINTNFAPVADVVSNYESPVRARSFGSDAELVTKMVSSELRAFSDYGVISCLKHFPGIGSVSGDTHNGAASSDKTWEELLESDLLPFKKAVSDDDADMIMVSHVKFPEISSDGLPASLSNDIIYKKLRKELGFSGVVITDALAMDAIAEEFSPSEAAVLAIRAGADLILMPANLEKAYNGVLAAVKSGDINENRLDQSVLRILTLKEKYGIITTH